MCIIFATLCKTDKLYKDVNNCIFIQLQRFRWTGHLRQLNDARNTKNRYRPNLNQQRCTGTPETKWKYDVENDIKQMGIFNRSEVTQDRVEWRRATGEALVLLR
jgi:hypothetical protein